MVGPLQMDHLTVRQVLACVLEPDRDREPLTVRERLAIVPGQRDHQCRGRASGEQTLIDETFRGFQAELRIVVQETTSQLPLAKTVKLAQEEPLIQRYRSGVGRLLYSVTLELGEWPLGVQEPDESEQLACPSDRHSNPRDGQTELGAGGYDKEVIGAVDVLAVHVIYERRRERTPQQRFDASGVHLTRMSGVYQQTEIRIVDRDRAAQPSAEAVDQLLEFRSHPPEYVGTTRGF